MTWIPWQPARDGVYWWREHEDAQPLLIVIREGHAHLLVPEPELRSSKLSGQWCDEPVTLPETHSGEHETARNLEILVEALASKSPAINEWAIHILKRIEIRLEASEHRELAALEQQTRLAREHLPTN
jgi:hypothetical protein